LDASGKLILWAGGFENSFGGYIGAYELTKSSQNTSTQTENAAKAEADAKAKAEQMKKTTIQCIKGKTIKRVTGINPKCPAGYKKK
jgi:hypothetical protein